MIQKLIEYNVNMNTMYFHLIKILNSIVYSLLAEKSQNQYSIQICPTLLVTSKFSIYVLFVLILDNDTIS